MNPEVICYPREAIEKATETFTTPFFLYEEKRLRDNCRRFKAAFDKHFPGFRPLFAVKANPNPELLKIIMEEGFAMDASSEAEAYLCGKLGVAGMYTGNYTSAETLKYAADRGFILNLDDIGNVAMLDQAPEMLSFRINPSIGNSTTANNVFAGPDAKYGVPFEKAPEAYAAAKKLGVQKFGIHMMTGSNIPIEQADYFAAVVRRLFEIVAQIREKTGIIIELMNIGGGFGVPYHPDEKSLDMNAIAASIRGVFDEQCKKHGLQEPILMAEPGRYIAADAGWLVGRVVLVKDGYKKFVGIDASTNDMPRPAFYDAYHHVSVLTDEVKPETVSIVGSICENNDQFAKDRKLPVCKPGDIVIIHNSGGHARAMGHNYNGRLRHAEYLLEIAGNLRQIRRAETFKDLYATVDL